VSGCGFSIFNGNNVSANLAPIHGGGSITITIHATAPKTPGVYCNEAKADINPFPRLTYFEGDQVNLTKAQACVQVNALPAPVVTKTFKPSIVNVGQAVNIVFTITGQGPQSGLTFSDVLPNPPFTSATGE